MKSPLKKSIGEVVTDYGARVMKVFKKGLLQRSLFDFYGDVKADKLRVKESSSVPSTPIDGDGGVIYTKAADGKLYYKSNEVAEVELSAADTVLTSEQVQDIVGAMFSSNTETNITVTYQDADGTIDLVATDTNTQLTTEEVQDIVGAMFTSNTETRISATYEDADGTIDLVVDDMTADTNTQLTNEEVQDIVGAMFTGNTETRISATYQDSDGTIDLVVNDIPVDLTISGDGTVHADNYINTVPDATNVAAAGALMDSELTDLAGIKSLDTSTIVTLSGNQTITGTKTFEKNVILDGNKSVTAGSDGVTLHVDAQDITDTSTSGSGTAASFNHVVVENPRLMATNSSVTTTTASTVFIKGAPVASTNQTITNAYALNIAGGAAYFGGDIIAGNDTIKDSGGNTIISSDGSGVVTMAGGNIAVGGSNANLNMNSGSDIILEADNAGGGNTSTIQYLDAGGANRIILGADSDVAILSNRASNGTVQIRANTSTAGGSGEVTVVTVQDTQVDISKDLNVTGIITGKQKQMFHQSFHDDIGTTKHFMPWGGTLEQSSNAYQEEVAMAMPYGGRIVSCLVRSQAINSSGNLTIGIESKEPGALVGSSWTSEETETLSVGSTDANHAFHFVFSDAAHFDPGDLVAMSIQASSDLSGSTYWYVTTVVEFDLNDPLGTSSAEYDTGQ